MCTNGVITFSNTSTSLSAQNNFTNFTWNYGDGTSATFTTQTSPTHTYNIVNGATTHITVTLTAQTVLGCNLITTNSISISRPVVAFTATSSVGLNICTNSGDSINFSSTTPFPNMTWYYGDGDTLGPTPPSTNNWHQYNIAGTYTPTLIVVNSLGCKSVKTGSTIKVQESPIAIITSAAFGNNLCYPLDTTFTDNSIVSPPATRVWNTFNGQTINNNLATITPTTYTTRGTYTISLTESTSNGCSNTATYTFIVNGPVANITVSRDTICKGKSITFSISDTSDVGSWYWDFGDGVVGDTGVSPITHIFNYHPTGGSSPVELIYWSPGKNCVESTPIKPIYIYEVIASFTRNHGLTLQDTAHCLGLTDTLTNTSQNSTTNTWNFGDGSSISTTVSPLHTYTAQGIYNVQLSIQNTSLGCVDTIVKQMIIYPPFNNEAVNSDTICFAQTASLTATGNGITYTWTPVSGLSSTSIANPTASPSVTTTYTLTSKDSNGCIDTTSALVFVHQPPKLVNLSDTIIIGQTITLPGGQAAGFTYSWTPTTSLSCTSCPTPVFNGTNSATYTESITFGSCFNLQSTFTITVEPLSTINLPDAFTPNGDGTNDVIYVSSLGLKSLNYFKIFNRWGELVFQSTDFKDGWDGTYQGTPQNIETYVYEVSAIAYIGNKTVTKKGYIKLLK